MFYIFTFSNNSRFKSVFFPPLQRREYLNHTHVKQSKSFRAQNTPQCSLSHATVQRIASISWLSQAWTEQHSLSPWLKQADRTESIACAIMKIALWQAKREGQTPTSMPSQKTSPKTPSRGVMNSHTSNWWWCVTARVGRRGLLRDGSRAARDWESENCIVKKSEVSVIDSLLHTHTNSHGSTGAHTYVSPDSPFPISWRWEIQSPQRNAIYSASSSHTYTQHMHIPPLRAIHVSCLQIIMTWSSLLWFSAAPDFLKCRVISSRMFLSRSHTHHALIHSLSSGF